ncbi:MAG: glycoside hydrolase family 28 protein [Verrucomicrobia bacterium]|nr:glycoside hydrolase family 28 protein [Verrucomicrobiota bacterium]
MKKAVSLKRVLTALASATIALNLPSTGIAAGERPDFDAAVAEILARIVEPTFPDRDFRIDDFGAKPETVVTEAIAAAIAACAEAGGGRVVIPGGQTFFTGPIHLRSNVNLHLEDGAVLKFSTDPNDYLPAVFTRWEGVEMMGYSPLIYAFEVENIAITGNGTLDGQASVENWWPWKGQERRGWREGDPHQYTARAVLFEMAEAGVPPEERIFAEGSYLRPMFIQPYRSRNILIQDITILRAPMWQIHPVLCTNVTIRGVTVISHGPNNDGCNPESSTDVLIEDSLFDTGDDCIAIKAGRNADGRRLAVPSQNIVIRNNVMRDGHGGVVMGSEMSGGVRNVFIDNCTMSSPRLQRALRIKTNSYRGGFVENVYMRNVRVGQVADAIFRVNFLYEEGAGGPHLPTVRNIILENVTSGQSRFPLYMVGFAESPIENVQIINSRFEGAQRPSVMHHVRNMTFDGYDQNTGVRSDMWGMPLPDAQ